MGLLIQVVLKGKSCRGNDGKGPGIIQKEPDGFFGGGCGFKVLIGFAVELFHVVIALLFKITQYMRELICVLDLGHINSSKPALHRYEAD